MKELIKFTVKQGETPVEFTFLAPPRAALKEGEVIYAKSYADCLRKGYLTNAEATKLDEQRGGAFSKEEVERVSEIIKQAIEIQAEVAKETTSTDKKLELEARLKELNDDYAAFRQRQDSVFNHTAETRAREQVIFHYALAMTHRDGKPYFEGKDFDSRMKFFEIKSEDIFHQGVYNRAVWYAAGYVSGLEDLKAVPFPEDRDIVAEEKAIEAGSNAPANSAPASTAQPEVKASEPPKAG